MKDTRPIDPELHTKLRWHIYVLRLFIIDYACFNKFGNSELKNQILDAFYDHMCADLSSMQDAQKLVKAVKHQIIRYGDAVRGKSIDDLLPSLGIAFSDAVDEPSQSLIFLAAGSIIFTSFYVTLRELLDDIKLKEN